MIKLETYKITDNGEYLPFGVIHVNIDNINLAIALDVDKRINVDNFYTIHLEGYKRKFIVKARDLNCYHKFKGL